MRGTRLIPPQRGVGLTSDKRQIRQNMNTLKLILGLGGCAQPNPAAMASATVLQDSHAIWISSSAGSEFDAASATDNQPEIPDSDG